MQLRLGEDSGWEFKAVEFAGDRPEKSATRRLGRRDLRVRQHSNGGVILCGVTDEGEVQGMSRSQMDELERLISEVCTDSVRPSLSELTSSVGRSLRARRYLMVDVPEGQHTTRQSRRQFRQGGQHQAENDH